MNNSNRNPDLAERLLRYSAVASLTAASTLAFGHGAALADSDVVYSGPDVTLDPGSNNTFAVDFDNNGTPEFTLRVSWTAYSTITSTPDGSTYTYTYSGGWIDAISPHQSVSFLANSTGVRRYVYAKALAQDASISSGAASWGQATSWVALTTQGTAGEWLNEDGTEEKYLGVRYKSDGGQIHYGWVELTCTSQPNGGPQLTIHRYGHNTTPDEGIPAAVRANSLKTTSGLRAVSAAAFAALAGVLTWMRRKIARG